MKIKYSLASVAVAAALSFSSVGWAGDIDTFSVTQPATPLEDTTVGGIVSDNSVAGRALEVSLAAGTGARVHINGHLAHSQDAPSSRAYSRATWTQGTWAGLPQDISTFAAVEVVVSEADLTANGLALTINTTGGNATVTGNLPQTTPPAINVVSVPLAAFGGIDLTNVTSMSMRIDGTGIDLDAVVDVVRVVGTITPPKKVPVMGGLGILMTLMGLFGIGRYFSRKRSA